MPASRAWAHRSFVCSLYRLPSFIKYVPHWRKWKSQDTQAPVSFYSRLFSAFLPAYKILCLDYFACVHAPLGVALMNIAMCAALAAPFAAAPWVPHWHGITSRYLFPRQFPEMLSRSSPCFHNTPASPAASFCHSLLCSPTAHERYIRFLPY